METCGKDIINKGQLWSKEHSPRPWFPCNGSRRKTNQASDCCDCNRWHELAVSSRAVRWELHRRGIPWLAFSCIRAVTCLWTPWCQKLKRRDSAAVPCALDSSLKRTHTDCMCRAELQSSRGTCSPAWAGELTRECGRAQGAQSGR